MAKYQIIKVGSPTTSYANTGDKRIVKKVEEANGKYPIHIIADGGVVAGMYVVDSGDITKSSTAYKISIDGSHFINIRIADGYVNYSNS